jgi:uncharacterized damage-inducible protein DinB
MTISELMLPEFDHEMASTRKNLERVPDQKFAWQPHPKSFSFGALATHLANIPGWASLSIGADSFDMAPGGVPRKMPQASSISEVLEAFDRNVAAARTAIAGATDEELIKPWSLLHNGQTLLTMPKMTVLRSFVLNHAVHHRAQLGVYLRLNDLPVPSVYGPSADESGM